jgi:formiminotetrahydrofolate cyclodeaminase
MAKKAQGRKKTRAKATTKSKARGRSTPLRIAARARSAKPKSSRKRETSEKDSLDALVASAAQALGIACDPEWLPEIKTNLQVTLRMAALVEEFALPDEAEPGPVFRA